MIRTKAILVELANRDLLDSATVIAKAHHVTLAEMFGDNRYPPAVFARQEFWHELFDDVEVGWTISRIAALVGRDRTTIRKGIDAHKRRVAARAA